MKIVDYGHVAGYGRKDRFFSLTRIRQMAADPPTLGKIVQGSVETCEVIHT
jgi:hypothetical protein